MSQVRKSKEIEEIKPTVRKSRLFKIMARGGKREGAGRKAGTSVVQVSVPKEIKLEMRELAREHATAALETLVKICKMSDSDAARVSAANAILDRGYGKPLQQIESGGAGDFSSMPDHELDEFLKSAAQELGLTGSNARHSSKH